MRGATGFLCLIIFLCSSVLSQILPLRTNDRLSGTSLLQLTPENLSRLALQTSNLLAKKKSVRAEYRPGVAEQFYAFNFETDKYESVQATLIVVEGGIHVWVQDSETANGHITNEVVQNIKDNLIYRTPAASIDSLAGIIRIVNDTFGQPPDFDKDGITDFLIMDIKDGSSEGEGFIAGYFNPLDQYLNGTSTGGMTISGSNERDILYIDSYPGIFNNGTYRYEAVLSTVSHEYQHLVQYNYDRSEESFVNEGLSELSSFLCGYGLRNPSLYLLNSDLSLTAWSADIDEALKHYAKTALWTYYLYEKYGLELIRAIAQNGSAGVTGIRTAISQLPIAASFEQILTGFYYAIILNEFDFNPLYGFQYPALSGLKAVPVRQIYDYPEQVARSQLPYSLNLIQIENGQSLQITIDNTVTGSLLQLYKLGIDQNENIIRVTGSVFEDGDFGNLWNSGYLMSLNTTENQGLLSLGFNARQKYYVSSGDINISEPDITINFGLNTIANSFLVPYDSCILRSVKLYQGSITEKGKLYIYESAVDANQIPEYRTKHIAGLIARGWNEIDLSDLNILRNRGGSFDLGFEFDNAGSAGYSDQGFSSVTSFMKTATSAGFLPLSSFKADNATLNGTWMINITYYAPLKYKPVDRINIPASFVIDQFGPNPFPIPGNPDLTILYTLSRPGNLNISIFDINGRLVKEVYNGYESGLTGGKVWHGINKQGAAVASGSYFLRFNFEGVVEHRKILILR
jgi:hypothetical protein